MNSKRQPKAVTANARVDSPRDETLVYITVADVAAIFGLSKRTVFRMKAEGRLPEYDYALSQRRFWKLSTVRAAIEGQPR